MSKKDKPAPAPDVTLELEPEPVVVIPSRGALLNRFATYQAKLTKLTLDIEDTKAAMLRAASLLREHYDIIVSDARFTTPAPAAGRQVLMSSTPMPTQPAPPPLPEELDAPVVPDEENLMLRAASKQGIIIDSPRTTPASENEVAAIRKGARLAKDTGENPDAFRADIANTMGNLAKAVRGGMGKASTIPAQPERSKT